MHDSDNTSSTDTDNTLRLTCPTCQTSLVWSTDNPFRPFCSESCKNKDFIGWANETHRIGGSEEDEIFSSDLEPR